MSEGIDPSTQVRRTRPDDSNSSNGNLAIVLAVVAVVVGFLILRTLNKSDGATVAVGGETTTTTLVVTSIPVATTPAPQPTINFTGATILVANANGGPGTAGKMADQLKAAGAELTPKPVDAETLDVSQILYDETNPEALKVATSLTLIIPGAPAPGPLVGEPPLKPGADRQGAAVVFLLGKDLANVQLSLPQQPATTLTVVPTTTVPPAPAN